MIRGLYGMFHSSDAGASRAFMRDVMKLPFTDVGRGWLIFDLPEADVGFHPVDPAGGPKAGTHDVSFFCDDIRGTVADLRKRGVQFAHEPRDQGYGFVTYFAMPGGIEVQLYEPKYQKRSAKPAARTASKKKAAKKKKKAAKKKKVLSIAKAKPKRTGKAKKGARR